MEHVPSSATLPTVMNFSRNLCHTFCRCCVERLPVLHCCLTCSNASGNIWSALSSTFRDVLVRFGVDFSCTPEPRIAFCPIFVECGRLRPISTSANFDFGQFRLRPISTSTNFWMLGILSYTPELHIAFSIFVHPLFPVFELHIQKWVIFVRRRPCVCDTFRFESPPLPGKKIDFGTDSLLLSPADYDN